MSTTTFRQLGLPDSLLSALTELGYEVPTPIQQQSIPYFLGGNDLLAQAQTGTGKTAAFALPTLAHLELAEKKPQTLVIAPTRELAIQVAEAFQSYAKNLKDFHVTAIYGGQEYRTQLRALKRGVHVIVGTPGRVMDHMRRGSLSLDALKTVILDEADEMLKMGFIDDIEWILEQIPHKHQTGLFSATMPASIQKICSRYLNNPQKIQIKSTKNSTETIEQFYTLVHREQKIDLLTRFLEIEEVQATIIFSRTKTFATELAEKLQARGYAAAALHGDMAQSAREKVIERIKKSTLDIVVATDVAARGIDVERISHVINFDIPYDTESYIHRIGRTGRAGRQGKAILFVTPRERRLLNDIERAMGKSIQKLDPPSLEQMKASRSQQLMIDVISVLEKPKKLKHYHRFIENMLEQNDCTVEDIAAALACLIQKTNPLPHSELSPVELQKKKPSHKRKDFGKKAKFGKPKKSSFAEGKHRKKKVRRKD